MTFFAAPQLMTYIKVPIHYENNILTIELLTKIPSGSRPLLIFKRAVKTGDVYGLNILRSQLPGI